MAPEKTWLVLEKIDYVETKKKRKKESGWK